MGDLIPESSPRDKSRGEGPALERYELVPIGYVRSAIRSPEDAPSQGRDAGTEVWIDVLPEFRDGLEGLAGRERVLVICWLHRAPRDLLKVRPRGDASLPLTGVFATRSPRRPNPLAVYAAKVLEATEAGLRVAGVDAVDGTPVVDLKPYVPRLDG